MPSLLSSRLVKVERYVLSPRITRRTSKAMAMVLENKNNMGQLKAIIIAALMKYSSIYRPCVIQEAELSGPSQD